MSVGEICPACRLPVGNNTTQFCSCPVETFSSRGASLSFVSDEFSGQPKSSLLFQHGNSSLSNSSTLCWKTLLTCLGILVCLSGAMSYPVEKSGSSHSRGDPLPLWINPCRIPEHSLALDESIPFVQQEDAEIFRNILTQVQKAVSHAKGFMTRYLERTFNKGDHTPATFHETIHLDWLQNVSDFVDKRLDERIGRERLEKLKVEDTLKTMYDALQRFAVGLEEIVLDQSIYEGDFHREFSEAEMDLRNVLCELQIAMLEKDVTNEDVQRHVMPQQDRDSDDETTRSLRDWVIFRDYVNTLQYMEQTFGYFLRVEERRS